MKIGYARVSKTSSDEMNIETQRRMLEDAGCERLYEDSISGDVWKRPGLDALEDALRPGDQVTVTAIDRLGRTALECMETITDWHSRGVVTNILNIPANVNDVSSGGHLLALVSAGFAEMEHQRIRERVQAGVDRAKAQGKYRGKKYAFSRSQMLLVHRLHDDGLTYTEIARSTGLSYPQCRRIIKTFPHPNDTPDYKFAAGKEL